MNIELNIDNLIKLSKTIFCLRFNINLLGETGGVYVYSKPLFRNKIVIHEFMMITNVSQKPDNHYEVDLSQHEKTLKSLINRFPKYNIGIWHTHPNGNAQASIQDDDTAKMIVKITGKELHSMILTGTQIRIYIYSKNQIKQNKIKNILIFE